MHQIPDRGTRIKIQQVDSNKFSVLVFSLQLELDFVSHAVFLIHNTYKLGIPKNKYIYSNTYRQIYQNFTIHAP